MSKFFGDTHTILERDLSKRDVLHLNMHSASWHASYSRDIVMCVTFAKIPKRVHGHASLWRNQWRQKMQHITLAQIKFWYCMRVTKEFWDLLLGMCKICFRTLRIWRYTLNKRAFEETNGAKRCSTSHLLTSCPEIISTSSNNILICSFGQWMHRVLECVRNHKFPLYVRKTGGAGAATHTSM